MAIQIKAGDTAPTVHATLLDADGEPVNLTDASARFVMAVQGTLVTSVDALAEVRQNGDGLDGSMGTVEYVWSVGDTTGPGEYWAEFEVTYSDGAVQTFPTVDYIPVTIYEDLGGTV